MGLYKHLRTVSRLHPVPYESLEFGIACMHRPVCASDWSISEKREWGVVFWTGL